MALMAVGAARVFTSCPVVRSKRLFALGLGFRCLLLLSGPWRWGRPLALRAGSAVLLFLVGVWLGLLSNGSVGPFVAQELFDIQVRRKQQFVFDWQGEVLKNFYKTGTSELLRNSATPHILWAW